MFLINGLEQESLPASDRATQFGDGCFTTARIADGDVCLLDAHIRRLQNVTDPLYAMGHVAPGNAPACVRKAQWGTQGHYQPRLRWTGL